MTYLVISLPFMLVGLILWGVRRKAYKSQGKVTLIVTATLLILTAIFDNLMIAAGLVGYDQGKNLGVYVGYAPIEDFLYPIFAVLMITAFWPATSRASDRS